MTDITASMPDGDLDPASAALAAAVLEVGRHVGNAPLPGARWFALMRTAELLADQPGLAAVLGDDIALSLAQDELHLTAVELDQTVEEADPLRSLEHLEWPRDVTTLAVAFELTAARWKAGPGTTTPSAGTDLRGIVAAQSDGVTFTAVQRDRAEDVALGRALIPDVSDALLDALSVDG